MLAGRFGIILGEGSQREVRKCARVTPPLAIRVLLRQCGLAPGPALALSPNRVPEPLQIANDAQGALGFIVVEGPAERRAYVVHLGWHDPRPRCARATLQAKVHL